MSTPAEILDGPMAEAARLLPGLSWSPEVKVMLVAIALQESGLVARRQYGNGPARGLWQNERGTPQTRGGVTGIMMHSGTSGLAKQLADARKVAWNSGSLWAALETDDVLATGFARLLLWTNPKRIPQRDEVDEAYSQYVWCWRPGKPHLQDWPVNHGIAVRAVFSEG